MKRLVLAVLAIFALLVVPAFAAGQPPLRPLHNEWARSCA